MPFPKRKSIKRTLHSPQNGCVSRGLRPATKQSFSFENGMKWKCGVKPDESHQGTQIRRPAAENLQSHADHYCSADRRLCRCVRVSAKKPDRRRTGSKRPAAGVHRGGVRGDDGGCSQCVHDPEHGAAGVYRRRSFRRRPHRRADPAGVCRGAVCARGQL